MTKGMDLYRLQCLDSEGDAKRRLLAQVEAALGESEALRQARRDVESAQALAHKCALRQRDLELEVQGLADKLSRTEQSLYGGAVKNPKELEELQDEAALLQRHLQKLEDDLLEVMVKREEAEAAHAQAQERLGEVQEHWSAQQAELMSEQAELQKRLAEIEQARVALTPKIGPGDLTTYQSLRRKKGGLAVVPVRDGACGGCGVIVSPKLEWQLREEKPAFCGNCERVVVRV